MSDPKENLRSAGKNLLDGIKILFRKISGSSNKSAITSIWSKRSVLVAFVIGTVVGVLIGRYSANRRETGQAPPQTIKEPVETRPKNKSESMTYEEFLRQVLAPGDRWECRWNRSTFIAKFGEPHNLTEKGVDLYLFYRCSDGIGEIRCSRGAYRGHNTVLVRNVRQVRKR